MYYIMSENNTRNKINNENKTRNKRKSKTRSISNKRKSKTRNRSNKINNETKTRNISNKRKINKSNTRNRSNNRKEVRITSPYFKQEMQYVQDRCYDYRGVKGGILKLSANDIPMKTLVSYYLLPKDIDKFKADMITYPEYGYLYVYGYDKTNNIVMGIVGFNPHEFANGHTMCAKMMEEDLGDTFYVVLSGTIFTKDKKIFMNDESGHYHEYILPFLQKINPNFDILKYYNKYISKNINTLLDTQTNIIFKSYEKEGSFEKKFSYDNIIVENRFYDRICKNKTKTGADFNIYDSVKNCSSDTDPIGKYCDKGTYQKTEIIIAEKIMAKYNSYDVNILKLIQTLYDNNNVIENTELVELYKIVKGRTVSINTVGRTAVINVLKSNLNLKNHLHIIQKLINQKTVLS